MAKPQTSVPARKASAASSSAGRVPNRCFSIAAAAPPTMAATRKTVKAQLISPTPPSSTTAVGSEVETRKALSAYSATPRHSVATVAA